MDQRLIMAKVLKDIPTITIGWYLTMKDDYQFDHFRCEDRDALIEWASIWCEWNNVSDEHFEENAEEFLKDLIHELTYGKLRREVVKNEELLNTLYSCLLEHKEKLYDPHLRLTDGNCIVDWFLRNHRLELQLLVDVTDTQQLLLESNDPEAIVLVMHSIFEPMLIKNN